MLQKCLPFLLVFTCINLQAQKPFVDAPTARQLKIKTATKTTNYPGQLNATIVTETYDTKGQQVKSEPVNTNSFIFNYTLYSYNEKGLLETETRYSGKKDKDTNVTIKAYTYNDYGRVSEIISTNKKNGLLYREQYVYFSSGKVITGSENSSYNSLGKLTYVNTYSYNPKGDIIEQDENLGSPETFAYTYNKQGLTTRKITKGPMADYVDTTNYTYDNKGRLLKSIVKVYYDNTLSNQSEILYSYNENGLLIKEEEFASYETSAPLRLVFTHLFEYTYY